MPINIPLYVSSLDPYKPGNQRKKVELKENVKEIISLASNENPLGTPKSVIEAIQQNIDKLSLYPDPSSNELVELLAKIHNKKPSQIVCGHGSESLIAHIVNAFSDIDTRVLTSGGTFAGIYVKTHKIGRKINKVPLNNFAYDLEAIVDRIRPDTRIIYISNPNNPTGTMIHKKEFDWFIQQVPENILIIFDEAYSIYAAQHSGYINSLDYDLPNMISLFTLSKTHGLAGLRIGYAIGPEKLIQTIYNVKLPFEPSFLAQKAAIAALNDLDYVDHTIQTNAVSLEMMLDTFDNLGIKYVEPKGNFVLITLESSKMVEEFCKHALYHGIAVRNCTPFGIENGVRISSTTLEHTNYACEVFEHVYNDIKGKY